MFCKFCGQSIDENSVFCSKCGKEQSISNSSSISTNGFSVINNLNSSLVKFMITNLVLVLSYFVGWIKLTGVTGLIAEFIREFAGFDIKQISPKLVIDAFSKIKSLVSITSQSIPIKYYSVYLFLVFPVLAGLGILLVLIQKPKTAALLSKLSAIIALLCAAATWYTVFEKDINATIWLYLLTAASIYMFFVISEIAGSSNKNSKVENISEEERLANETLTAAEMALLPEKKRNKILAAKQEKNLKKQIDIKEQKEEDFDFCYFCGADITGNYEKCPTCEKPIQKNDFK